MTSIANVANVWCGRRYVIPRLIKVFVKEYFYAQDETCIRLYCTCVHTCLYEKQYVLMNLGVDAGVYGIVVRVKILYNKKDTALVQFSDPQQAQTGC